MSTIINATTTNGVVIQPDNSGSLQLQTNSGTTAITIDTSQNVGIGTTPSSSQWSGTKALQLGATAYISGRTSSASGVINISNNAFLNSTPAWQYITTNGCAIYEQSNDVHIWNNAPSGTAGTTFTPTERMRIDSSGNLTVANTVSGYTAGSKGFLVRNDSASGTYLQIGATTTSSFDVAYFYNPNGNVGKISVSGSNTSYVTSSDYRLKENIVPMTGALDVVSALKPVTYTWKVDGSEGQGFIAHELQEVVPDCVSGEKDAVDTEGNPQYQGIDTSFLVATLTAAIQEQQTIINDLKARVETLETK